MDHLHDDVRDATRDHDVEHDVEQDVDHDEASVATETTESAKPFPVLEEPTWLDAEDDE